MFPFAHVAASVAKTAAHSSKVFPNFVVFSPPTVKQNEFTVLKQPLTRSALHGEKNRHPNRIYIKSKKERETRTGERKNRATSPSLPNQAITLGLITSRDVRPSMKHVYYNHHQYHNTMRASTHSAYHCREWEHFSRKIELQIFLSRDHSAVRHIN